jgi:hypothetical protein
MPPVTDFIHRYRVPPNTIEAKCRIRVYQLANGTIVVIATELPDSAGASITNAAEILATEMRRWFVVPGGGLFWIEHYQDRAMIGGRPQQKESFDRVFFRWDGTQYDDPDWKPFSRQQVEALIGEPLTD